MSEMNRYILENRKAVPEPDLMKWANWIASTDRVIEKTQINPGVNVSTVFLGVDHQFGEGPPLIFETMIFGGNRDQDQWRYSTYEQAASGHRAVVETLST